MVTRLRSALVTGATGFIGSALVRRLLAKDVRVFCLVRSSGTDHSRLQALAGSEVLEVRSFQVDELRQALMGVSADVVFHLAAYGVPADAHDPQAMLDGNVNLIAYLLLATADWPLRRFVHTGSCSEYGGPSGWEPLIEDHPIRPISLYGAAKAASVLYGNALAARLRIPFVTLRLFGVYGVGEGPNRLIPYIINRLECNEPVDLTPGEQVRDFLYVEDVVEAFLAAANPSHLECYHVYNVCSGIPTRVRDVGEAVARAMRKDPDLLQWGQRAYRPGEPMWMVGNGSRFVDATGWRPAVSLTDGIHRMLAALAGGDTGNG